MKIAAIVAMDKNNAIGKNNKLPWHISDDLKLFKKVTLNHAIVMGHNTYVSMGKALPNRVNIVMSRNKDLKLEDAIVLNSVEDVLHYAQSENFDELYIIGGAQIFKLWEDQYDAIYVSKVDTVIDNANVHFPALDWSQYSINLQRSYPQKEKNDFAFKFCLYQK